MDVEPAALTGDIVDNRAEAGLRADGNEGRNGQNDGGGSAEPADDLQTLHAADGGLGPDGNNNDGGQPHGQGPPLEVGKDHIRKGVRVHGDPVDGRQSDQHGHDGRAALAEEVAGENQRGLAALRADYTDHDGDKRKDRVADDDRPHRAAEAHLGADRGAGDKVGKRNAVADKNDQNGAEGLAFVRGNATERIFDLRTALLCSFLFGLFGHGKNSSRSFYEMCASERHISFTFSDYSTFHTKYNPYSLSKTINRHIIHILLRN